MSWEEGLSTTVEWYKKYTGRFGNIDDALVAHPRIGVAPGAAVTNVERNSIYVKEFAARGSM